MFWSSEDYDHTWPIRRPDGSFSNLITHAVGQDRPLWVVGNDKETLADADELVDAWSGGTELGTYQPSISQPIKTLVVLPLKRRRTLGVCYFESTAHIGITEVAKTELQLLAEAIAIMLELYDVNRAQSQMTAWALDELQDRLVKTKFPRLTKPHFFVAYSNRADEPVVNVIREVLYDFSDRLEFTDWSRISEAGNINTQIAKEITRSRFGICYLSQPAKASDDPTVKYEDNPNVVFEAGMLRGKAVASDTGEEGEPSGWIPMRESASPPAPFDFAAERTLVVPRFPDGTLKESPLREALTTRITRLLRED
jgi:hypothetical protein